MLLVALASLIALTTLMLSSARRIYSAAAASRRTTVGAAPADDAMASALARALLHLRRGEVVAGSSYALPVRVPGGSELFRLDCEANPPDQVDLTATPATESEVAGLPVLVEALP